MSHTHSVPMPTTCHCDNSVNKPITGLPCNEFPIKMVLQRQVPLCVMYVILLQDMLQGQVTLCDRNALSLAVYNIVLKVNTVVLGIQLMANILIQCQDSEKEKTVELLRARRDQYKVAALTCKRAGDIPQAKSFLGVSKVTGTCSIKNVEGNILPDTVCSYDCIAELVNQGL